MQIRKANINDIPSIIAIYQDAQAALRANGVNQWQDECPNKNSAMLDIQASNAYVAEKDGKIMGTACIVFGTEPTYSVITEGNWHTSSITYGFLHRVAVATAAKGCGLVSEFFRYAEKLANKQGITTIRCDTHRDNLPMQRALQKNGFYYCGVIFIENGDERLAYEKILTNPTES